MWRLITDQRSTAHRQHRPARRIGSCDHSRQQVVIPPHRLHEYVEPHCWTAFRGCAGSSAARLRRALLGCSQTLPALMQQRHLGPNPCHCPGRVRTRSARRRRLTAGVANFLQRQGVSGGQDRAGSMAPKAIRPQAPCARRRCRCPGRHTSHPGPYAGSRHTPKLAVQCQTDSAHHRPLLRRLDRPVVRYALMIRSTAPGGAYGLSNRPAAHRGSAVQPATAGRGAGSVSSPSRGAIGRRRRVTNFTAA